MKLRALTTAAVATFLLAFVFGSVASSAAAKKEAPKDVFACTLEYQPVCGTLDKKRSTFGNMCQAKQAGATKIQKGPCA